MSAGAKLLRAANAAPGTREKALLQHEANKALDEQFAASVPRDFGARGFAERLLRFANDRIARGLRA